MLSDTHDEKSACMTSSEVRRQSNARGNGSVPSGSAPSHAKYDGTARSDKAEHMIDNSCISEFGGVRTGGVQAGYRAVAVPVGGDSGGNVHNNVDLAPTAHPVM